MRPDTPFRLLIAALSTALSLSAAIAAVQDGTVESWDLKPIDAEGYVGPLFETISPEYSGLDAINEYSHPEAWGKYWHQYYNGSIGAGVVLGDVNGDELPDIFLVSKDGADSLYLNRGDFQFEDVSAAAGVEGKSGFGAGASLIDIDNDGDLDLYVCYIGSANELFINDGQGVFVESAEAWGLDIDTGSNAPSFADFDKDGDLDLYLQCNFLESANKPEGMPDFLFENKGDRFEDITEKAGIAGRGQGHAAIWWDYNEDGWPDLYVANDFAPTDKLYRNNKDKTFTDVIEEALVSAPYFGMGGDLGDINNDGHIDFLVADMASPDHVKHHVSVGTQASYLLGISKSKISQYMYNMLSLKIGPEQFAEVGHLSGLAATGWTWAVRLVDMDNDGLLDAYFANGMVREFHNSDLAARMGQARSVMMRIRAYENSPPLNEANLSFRNRGDLSFEETGPAWGLDAVGVSFAASFADFDQDGDLDLVVNNLNGPPLLYKNRSAKGHRVTIKLDGSSSNRSGYGARLTAKANGTIQTRELSSTRGYMSQDEAVAHFSFLDAESIDELAIVWPSGARQILRDLPTGKRYRIREANTESDSSAEAAREPLFVRAAIEVPDDAESEEEFYDVFAKQPLLPFDETWSGPEIAAGDIDGDGWVDVVIGGATGQETRVFRNEEGAALRLVESDCFFEDYDSEDSGLALFDYDGDGDLDLLALAGSMELDAGSEYYRDRIYLHDADLEFERLPAPAFPAAGKASRGYAVLDVNGDGRQDLLIGGGTEKDQYPFSSDNQVWLRGDSGYVKDLESVFALAFAKSGKISKLLVVDIDQDGNDDLLQALEWGSPILWRAGSGGLVRRALVDDASLQGLWSSLAVGDFDGDGDLDLFLGNIGQNSKYAPSVEAPDVLFSRIQDGAGAHLLAETIGGKLLPRETRNIASKLFAPEITAATRSYEQYATSPVEEVFPSIETEFRRDVMTESRSLVALQTSTGDFELQHLPVFAQTGVATDAAVADLNGDGFDDIVISHEPLPPVSWAGRRLKGHLSVLLGSGDGGFQTLLPWDSGLEVDGFPKHLALADLDRDGRPELLLTMNEGPLLVYEINERSRVALPRVAAAE